MKWRYKERSRSLLLVLVLLLVLEVLLVLELLVLEVLSQLGACRHPCGN